MGSEQVVFAIVPINNPESRFLDREAYGFTVRPGSRSADEEGTGSCGTCNGVDRYNVRTEPEENGQAKIVSKPCEACPDNRQAPA
jgi:hypothetical protein